MVEKLRECLENIFSNQKLREIAFWIFSILPLITADIVLRYVLNPIYMSSFYNLIPVLFNLFWLFFIIYTCRHIFPKNLGRSLYLIFSIVFGIWFFANFISFKMFSRYLWFESVLLASEATDYISVIGQYINLKVILVAIVYIGSVIITCILWGESRIKNRVARILPVTLSILGVVAVNTFMNIAIAKDKANGAWEVWDRPTLIYDKFVDANKSLNISGLYQYTFKSIYKTLSKENQLSIEQEEKVDTFFNTKALHEDNEMTGILKDKNIIFVLMESLDYCMLSEKYTPTIKYMMDNGINFTNHYMPNVGAGYTFNAEFAANTGYYCPTTETSASVFTKNVFPFTLANLANKEGYVSTSFHYNGRNFYNRAVMHKQFGYRDYKSFMKYLSIEKCVQDSEAVKSDKIYGMMTENEKFLDFIITYSPHLPYDKEDNKLKGALSNYPELIDDNLDLETRNALLLAHDTDEFFRILLERLKEDNLLEDTVIIAFTDHYSYGMSDKNKIKELRGKGEEEILERTPFFIYSPELKHKEVTKVTSSIDILPTVVNILGLEKTKYYIGNDAFDDKYAGLVYFPDGDWYDGELYYKNGEIVPQDKKEYVEEINRYITDITSINDYVISTDYFSRLNRKLN